MKKRKLSQKSLSVLKAIGELGATMFELMTSIPPDQYVTGATRVHYRRVYDLKRKGYVQMKKDKKNQSFFHLTPKGKLQLLKYLHLEKIKKGKWDRRWRIVVFDIPEKMKKWRNYIRHDLKELGFEPLQESVYITPYPVTSELDEKLKVWGLRKYFRYITVSEIDGEEKLKNEFNL